MKVKCNDGISRKFKMTRYRQGIFGINYFKCLECECETENPKCSTQEDLRDWAKKHICLKG